MSADPKGFSLQDFAPTATQQEVDADSAATSVRDAGKVKVGVGGGTTFAGERATKKRVKIGLGGGVRFTESAEIRDPGKVKIGQGGGARFAGAASTRDPGRVRIGSGGGISFGRRK